MTLKFMESEVIILLLLAIMAFLYASVGHGGASGYLAVMAIFNISPNIMKPSALMLNILVSLCSFIIYYREGYFRWKLFLPFAIGAIPLSFIGALIPISDQLYKHILAIILFFAVFRMLFDPQIYRKIEKPLFILCLFYGAIIGFLSGLLGIGGGILLSPLLLLLHWASLKETAAVSSLFIFTNSIAGLLGLWLKGFQPNADIFIWLAITFVGGVLGAVFGSKKLNTESLRYILATVLLIACFKLLT